MYELRREKQQEGRIDLVAVHVLGLPLEEVADRNGIYVDDAHSRDGGDHSRQRFLMRIMLVGGEGPLYMSGRGIARPQGMIPGA